MKTKCKKKEKLTLGAGSAELGVHKDGVGVISAGGEEEETRVERRSEEALFPLSFYFLFSFFVLLFNKKWYNVTCLISHLMPYCYIVDPKSKQRTKTVASRR